MPSRGSGRVLPQPGFVLATTQSGQEATAGAFWEAKPPQGNDSPAGQCDASTDVVPSQGKRQGAGKDPDVLSRCVRPLARYINEANSDSWQLSAADYLEMVRTSARLLGNLSAFCSRLRRSSVLQRGNSRIVDMADEDEIFQDAGRKLLGEGFTRKAKERDDELKSLAAQQVGDRHKVPTSRPFFPAVKPQRETSPRLQSQQREATFWTLPPHSGVEEGQLTEVTGSTTTPDFYQK